MSDELTGTGAAIIIVGNFLGGLALCGGEFAKIFRASVCNGWGIFEHFFTAFCGIEDMIVLLMTSPRFERLKGMDFLKKYGCDGKKYVGGIDEYRPIL